MEWHVNVAAFAHRDHELFPRQPRCPSAPPATRPTQAASILYPNSYMPLKGNRRMPLSVEGESNHSSRLVSMPLTSDPPLDCHDREPDRGKPMRKMKLSIRTRWLIRVVFRRMLSNGMRYKCSPWFTPLKTRSLPSTGCLLKSSHISRTTVAVKMMKA